MGCRKNRLLQKRGVHYPVSSNHIETTHRNTIRCSSYKPPQNECRPLYLSKLNKHHSSKPHLLLLSMPRHSHARKGADGLATVCGKQGLLAGHANCSAPWRAAKTRLRPACFAEASPNAPIKRLDGRRASLVGSHQNQRQRRARSLATQSMLRHRTHTEGVRKTAVSRKGITAELPVRVPLLA